MNVDFNNVRRQTCWLYDDLAKKLNGAIEEGYGNEKQVRIDVDEIQDIMDELRSLIMTSAWVFDKDNEDFKVVGDEVGKIAWFNPAEDQEDEDE